jgi:hypothetical protein
LIKIIIFVKTKEINQIKQLNTMIKETLKNAIRSLSNKHRISEKELRIKISKPDNSLKYEVMKNSEVLEETNIATALNLNTIVAFMVGNRLSTIIDTISKQNSISEELVNVRIYTKTEDCEPLLYLFKETNPVKPLNLDEYV